MTEEQQNALYAAARIKEQRQAEEAKRTAPIHRLTPGEREENRRKAKERQLLHDGLQHLQQGKPCTPTQALVVGAYVADYEARVKDLQHQAEAARIDAMHEKELYERIATEWNTIWDALQGLGLVLYGGGDDYGWRSTDRAGKEVERSGYASIGESLKAALLWWREQR